MRTCWIFDLDGTLANGDHRLHHIKKEPKDWTAYFAACGDDKPIYHNIAILNALASHYPIFIVSGRSDEVRTVTEAWLLQFIGRFDKDTLLMRPHGDHQDDDKLKMTLLKEIQAKGFEPLAAFDDRDRVVAAWRRIGIPCLQVAPGDF